MKTWATGARSNREGGPLCEARAGYGHIVPLDEMETGVPALGLSQLCSPRCWEEMQAQSLGLLASFQHGERVKLRPQ